MALEQIQGKAGSLTPDELDRLALQYKPSWEIDDIVAAASVVAVVSAPHANGNGAASHARAESADKPKVAPPIPVAAPRAAGIKATVMGTGALAETPPAVEAQAPAPPAEVEAEVEAVAVEQPSVPVESVETAVEAVEEIEAAPPVAVALEDAAPPVDVDVTESKETADIALGNAATIPATVVDLAGLSDAPAAIVAEHVESVNENAEEKPQAKPALVVAEEEVRVARSEAAAIEPPLDAIPMQGSSSGSIMKVVFALVAIVAIGFGANSISGGSEKDKPKPTTNAQTASPKETAEAKPEQPATPPPETPKAAAAATESPKPAKTEAPPPAEAPKAEAKTAEPPKPEAPKPEVPKPAVTTTAATKATVAVAAKPPAPAPAPRPTATATAKTGGGIIRETPF